MVNLINELNIGNYSQYSNTTVLYWALYQYVNAYPQDVYNGLSQVVANIEASNFAQAGSFMSGFL